MSVCGGHAGRPVLSGELVHDLLGRVGRVRGPVAVASGASSRCVRVVLGFCRYESGFLTVGGSATRLFRACASYRWKDTASDKAAAISATANATDI